MRLVKTGPPGVGLFLAPFLIVLGAILADLDHWTAAVIVVAGGSIWLVVSGTLFHRRVVELRQREQLTSRDLIEIEYPRFAIRAARGYLTVLAGMTGLAILATVIYFAITAVTR